MRLMQVHKSSSGDKPILPQPFDFSRYAGRQSKLLMRTDVKRREIWEWSDHTRFQQIVTQAEDRYDFVVHGLPLGMK